jgi:hypothetical protein
MPLVAPVITATLPSSRPISSPCRNRFRQYSRLSPTRQASLFHRDRPSLGALLPSAATKSPDFGMLGHILDSLIT